MGEIAAGGGGGHKKGGKVRSKKMSTRIDMTPMVDLAFLLLTFFVLTTTMNKPKTMEIRIPEKETKINALFGNKEQSMFVFIKPLDESNYKNVVDILDEMKVVDITKYALMEATGQDKNIIQQYAASMGAPNTP